jgi:hypothetical protein
MFIYQTHTEMVGYMMRKKKWLSVMTGFPDFYKILKQKFFQFYLVEVYRPLINEKNADIEYYEKRKDYNSVLAVEDKRFDDTNTAKLIS